MFLRRRFKQKILEKIHFVHFRKVRVFHATKKNLYSKQICEIDLHVNISFFVCSISYIFILSPTLTKEYD